MSKDPLRRRAEEVIKQRKKHCKTTGYPVDREALIEELQTHQIELELQNEELREASHHAETARNRYFSLFDIAPIPYVVLSSDHTIEQINLTGARLFQTERARLVGRTFVSLFGPDDRTNVVEHLSEVQEQGFASSERVTLADGSSATTFVRLESQRWTDPQENEKGEILVAIIDATAEAEVERLHVEQLRHHRRLLREMNHRAKNNFQMLSSIIHLDAQNHPGGVISTAVVERIRAMARIQNSLYHSTTDVGWVDIGAHFRELAREFAITFAPACDITLQLPAEHVELDSQTANSISIAVNELLTNAVRHARRDAGKLSVLLRAERRGDLLEVEVSDNGVNASCEMLKKKPGMGLTLVRQLIEADGGSWSIECEEGVRHILRRPLKKT